MESESFSIGRLQTRWTNNKNDCIDEIKQLTEYILANKTLRFTIAEIEAVFPCLISSGTLYKDGIISAGRDYGIKYTDLVLYGILQAFSTKYTFEITQDINTTLAFFQQVMDFFKTGQPVWGISQLLKSLSAFLLKTIFDTFPDSFYDLVLSLKAKPDVELFFIFFNASMIVVETIFIEPAGFWKMIKHFGVELGAPGLSDANWNRLTKVLGNRCIQSPSEMLPLADEVFVETAGTAIEPLGLAFFSALNKAGFIETFEIIEWLDIKSNKTFILKLVCFTNLSVRSDRLTLLQKLEIFKGFLPETDVVLPGVYSVILSNTPPDDAEICSRCESAFEAYLISKDDNIIRAALTAIVQCHGHERMRFNLLIVLLKSEVDKEKYTPYFISFVTICNSLPLYFEFLKIYVTQAGIKNYYDNLFGPAHTFRHDHQRQFDQKLFELLTDDEGPTRWMGHRLHHYFFTYAKLDITFNTENMSLVEQCKLCITMANSYRQPKEIIPVIAPLLQSKFEMITAITVEKLKELIDNYGYEIINLLQTSILLDAPENSSINQALMERIEILKNEFDVKKGMKELDPDYSQAYLKRFFTQAYTKRFKETSTKVMRETSVIEQFAKKIMVSRGAGFVSGQEKIISPFSTVSVSMSMPKGMFVLPELNDHLLKTEFLTNWKDLFETWEQTIS